MDVKDLRPKVFAVDPHCKDAKRQWLHWYRSFATYVLRLGEVSDADMYQNNPLCWSPAAWQRIGGLMVWLWTLGTGTGASYGTRQLWTPLLQATT